MLKAENIPYRTLELPVPGDLKGRQAPGVLKRSYLLTKRGMDLTCSLLVIAGILSWLSPLIAVLIKLDSRGPILFLQKRIGRGGKIFTCYKFRTMVVNPYADERPCVENDERITRFGKLLRTTHLDELPQFLNVAWGSMSLVGPRPYMLTDDQRISMLVPGHNFRNYVKPGITGLSQVKGYHGGDMDIKILFSRYQWDTFYVRNASLPMDLRVISSTMRLFFISKIGLWK
ncbi:MAG TPA: sugar transferase [Puia sp.]|jgi:putative colanic acid biosynthesis UDP-glucose lipid carrier transferase|nr:sugar transferase [Puia sp.]